MIGAHVPTPEYLKPLFSGFFDPVPYAGDGLAVPDGNVPPGAPIYWNGEYSRLKEWIDWLIQKHREGHYVALLIPMGDSSEARALIRYGIRRFIPDRRIFPEVRNVELVILTG